MVIALRVTVAPGCHLGDNGRCAGRMILRKFGFARERWRVLLPGVYQKFTTKSNMNSFSSFSGRVKAMAVVAALVVASASVVAQIKQGKTRALKTSQLMSGLVKPNCDALKKGLIDGKPEGDAWDELAGKAALLNEASYILMDDGRCPDGVWADATTLKLREGSSALLKALEAKDHAGAKAAFGTMTQSCKGCHEKHKPKKG